jgi:phosphoribosylaminoimidazole carboxylase (NCAIR synthetase)
VSLLYPVLPIAPFLDVAEQMIYAIKDAAARLGLLQGGDAQLVACAQDIAERTVEFLNGKGVFGVEMFLMTDGAFKYGFHSQVAH